MRTCATGRWWTSVDFRLAPNREAKVLAERRLDAPRNSEISLKQSQTDLCNGESASTSHGVFPWPRRRGDFTDILVKKQILGPDQLDEAEAPASSTGAKLQDALVKLGYATHERGHDAPSPSTTACSSSTSPRSTIPPAVIELVPESVARENVVLPLAQENGALKIIMQRPDRLRHHRRSSSSS